MTEHRFDYHFNSAAGTLTCEQLHDKRKHRGLLFHSYMRLILVTSGALPAVRINVVLFVLPFAFGGGGMGNRVNRSHRIRPTATAYARATGNSHTWPRDPILRVVQ